MINKKDIEKEAKERIQYVRSFSGGVMPIRILVKDKEQLKVYKKTMNKMRKVSNLSLKVEDK